MSLRLNNRPQRIALLRRVDGRVQQQVFDGYGKKPDDDDDNKPSNKNDMLIALGVFMLSVYVGLH